MPFLDYFRCCCCRKPPSTPQAHEVKARNPTMVSFDFDSSKGIRRAFDALPERTIPPRDAPRDAPRAP